MAHVLGCIIEQHDVRLVALAAFICGLACVTTCGLLSRAQVSTGRARSIWIGLAAAEFGGGVWALHFVAMLAYMPQLAIWFEPVQTFISALVPVGGALAAFSILARRQQTAVALAAATVLLAAAITGMHYLGVAAMRLPGVLEFDVAEIAWSVLACTLLSAGSVFSMANLCGIGRQVVSSVLLGLAICSLHFTGMAAVTIRLGGMKFDPAGRLDPLVLAVSVATVSIAVLTMSFAVSVADRHLSNRAVQEKERLRQLVDASFEGLLIERDGVISYVNQRLCELSGTGMAALVGSALSRLIVADRPGADGPDPGVLHLVRQNGSKVPVELLVREVTFDGRLANAVAVRDLTTRRADEAAILRLAHHDSLTGLANRVLLDKRLSDAIQRATAAAATIAVLCVDLDRFKPVNDLMGHAAGDKLLTAVAERLRAVLRQEDTLARIGGDEFAIVLASGSAKHMEVADRIVREISRPFVIDGQQVIIGASVGIATFPRYGLDGQELLRCADIALYSAKQAGRGTSRLFEPWMDEALQTRRALEHDLREALEQNRLELHYQPIVDCRTGLIEGHEALLRWDHRTRGMIPPSVFIPLAEETNLILPLGRWVMETACREAAGWAEPLLVAVNLSPVQFRDSNLKQEVFDVLAITGLDPRRLEIEVTEGVLIGDPDRAVDVLSSLRAAGVRVSLDDFGTGYSSLSYLRRFPLDKIKIDKSFVDHMATDEQSASIVKALISLAHTLELTVTAEGVETVEQLGALKEQLCNQVQGYLLGRPSRDRMTASATISPCLHSPNKESALADIMF